MRKNILTIVLMLALLMLTTSAYAAPSGLIANFNNNEVELEWDSEEGYNLGYDVWMSKNGFEWEKLNSSKVLTDNYIVSSDKILPYVNYYFIVTEHNVVIEGGNPMDYLNNATDIAIYFSQKDNVHGNYKENTNACAKCHRTHSGNGEALLITNTVNDTCITCHDGTQSKYDVLKGKIQTGANDFKNSNSGAFGDLGFFSDSSSSTFVATYNEVDKKYTVSGKTASWLELKAVLTKEYWVKIYVVPSGQVLDKTTHSKDSSGKLWNEVLQVNYQEAFFTDNNNLIPADSTVYVEFPLLEILEEDKPMSIHTMGNGINLRNALRDINNSEFPDGPEWQKPLGCGSCHSVHAQEFNLGGQVFYGSNYRMLTNKLPATKSDQYIRVLGFAETVNNDVYGFGEKIYYKSGMNDFCFGCHADYKKTVEETVGETVITTVYAQMKNREHAIDVSPFDYEGGPLVTNLPLQGDLNQTDDYTKNKIMCLTCHSAHGSNSYRNNPNEPNFLVRANGPDGICGRCHTSIGN